MNQSETTSAAGGGEKPPHVESFAINPEGGPDIYVEGHNRFVNEDDFLEYKAWAERKIAALAAPTAKGGTTPAGWKLVPIEPTEQMIERAVEGSPADVSRFDAEETWRAMIGFVPPARQRDVDADASTDRIIEEVCKPWKFSAGEPPEWGSPLHQVFVAGMVYSERLLAGFLDVTDYEAGDGSEDFDRDATKSLQNILTAAGLYDPEDGKLATIASPPLPAGAAGGGSGDLGALSAEAREAVLAVVRTAWALVDNTGHHDLLPLAINRDDWDELAARLTALKALLPAEELPADPPHAVAYFWPAEATPVLSAPTPDLGAQGGLSGWVEKQIEELDRLGREASDQEASANAEGRQTDADFCAGESNAYHEAAGVLMKAIESKAPVSLGARGEPVGDDILHATVNVRRDGSTSCQLRFGDKVKFPQGRSAVNQAIGALVTELQDSSACPASPSRATSDTQSSIRLLGMIEDGDLETPRQTLFAEWPNADCAAQCRMQARANLDPELSAFWIEVSRRLTSAPNIGAQDELQINQRDILFDALWRLSARLDIIDPKVSCGIPELLTAVEARMALSSVHGEASDLGAQGEPVAWAWETWKNPGDTPITNVSVEEIARAIDAVEVGYSINLKSLTPEGRVYTLDLGDGNALREFSDNEDAREFALRHWSLVRARAVQALFAQAPRDGGETQGGPAATKTEQEPNAAVTAEIERGLARCSDPVRYAIRKEASDLIGLHAPGNRHLEQAVIAALLRRTAQSQKGTAR